MHVIGKNGGRVSWGVFSAAGIGEMLYCEKLFHISENRRILQNHLLPTNEK